MFPVPQFEGVSEPSRLNRPQGLIDTHVHVWTDDFKDYPLSSSFTPGDMNPKVANPDDFLNKARLSGVDRAVLIQMSYYGCDNSYMLDVIRRFDGVFRGVAVVDWRGNHPDSEMCELANMAYGDSGSMPRESLLKHV